MRNKETKKTKSQLVPQQEEGKMENGEWRRRRGVGHQIRLDSLSLSPIHPHKHTIKVMFLSNLLSFFFF